MLARHQFVKFVGGICVLLVARLAQADRMAISLDMAPVTMSEADGFVDVAGGAGIALSFEPGQPRLPNPMVTYALPPDADLTTVAVTVDDVDVIEFSLDLPVRPAPPWRTSADAVPFYGDAKTIVEGKDMAVYGRDADFPASPVCIDTVSQMRRWKLVRVVLSPALYNPVQGALKQISRLVFTI